MKSLFYRPIKINPPPFFFNQKLILFLSSSAIFLTIGILVFAFSLPTVNPPQNNKSKPIDTTNTPQSKQGPLGATLFRDTSNQNYYLNPAGRSKLGGPLNLNNNPIKNVKDPVNQQDVATKAYVDKKISSNYNLSLPKCTSNINAPGGTLIACGNKGCVVEGTCAEVSNQLFKIIYSSSAKSISIKPKYCIECRASLSRDLYNPQILNNTNCAIYDPYGYYCSGSLRNNYNISIYSNGTAIAQFCTGLGVCGESLSCTLCVK